MAKNVMPNSVNEVYEAVWKGQPKDGRSARGRREGIRRMGEGEQAMPGRERGSRQGRDVWTGQRDKTRDGKGERVDDSKTNIQTELQVCSGEGLRRGLGRALHAFARAEGAKGRIGLKSKGTYLL